MRKLALILCVAFSTSIQASLITSHTFFSVRPFFQSFMPERVSFFRNELLDECQGFGGALEVVFFGSNSTKQGNTKLATFFLPPGCHTYCLNVREFNPIVEANPANTADGSPLKDLEARHFNIRTVNETFASRICIIPSQQVVGVGFCYKQTLSHKCTGEAGFYFEGSLPVMRVENRVCLQETIENNGGGPALNPDGTIEIGLDNSPRVDSMTAAFAQCNWHYGRIPNRKLTKWGVGDIELKIGYNSIDCERYQMNSYLGLVVPTGTRVRGKVLFEPIVGNNHHLGVAIGSSMAVELWKWCRYNCTLYLDNDTRYLFSNHQVRSFDLIYKPWGRYQETYNSSEAAAAAFNTANQNSGTSGINIFTQCVRVSPHLSSNMNTGFVITRPGDCTSWMFEGGWNWFARQTEVIELECNTTVSSAALKGISGQGTTTIARNIKDNFAASQFTFPQGYHSISNCDIDLESAAHPATLSTTVYATLGYRWERECPAFVALGGSYEFNVREVNNVLDRWLVWGKFGVTF